MSEEHRFRGALFGFNRQDVIQYVENTHRDYNTQLEELKKELEEVSGQLTEARQQQELAQGAAAAAEKEARQAREELTTVVSRLQEATEEGRMLQVKVQTTTKDLDDLQRAADRMAPAARSYEVLKERTASIELEAHNRAQTIIKAGEAQAERTRREVQAWLEQVRSSYLRLKADMAATLTHTRTELDRTGKALEQVDRELEGHSDKLDRIAAEVEKPLGGAADETK